MSGKKPWKKVLYESQNYPDNYTDKEMFLRDLRYTTKHICLSEAIMGATLLLEEFCTVIAFVLIYVYFFNEWVKPELIFNWSCVLTIVGFIFYKISQARNSRTELGHDLRTVLIFMVFGNLFSPILHTLTDTISTDTIYTMTFLMAIVHLLFYDYGVNAAIVSNSLSLNAAIFASICLASRLSSAHHAFIFIAIAVQFFVLFPILRNKMKKSFYFAGLLFILDVYFLTASSQLFAVIFVSSVFFIGGICPILFVKYQKYKSNIYGPWDEAIVDDADNVIYKLD